MNHQHNAGVTRRVTPEDLEALMLSASLDKAKIAALCSEIEEMSIERAELIDALSKIEKYGHGSTCANIAQDALEKAGAV